MTIAEALSADKAKALETAKGNMNEKHDDATKEKAAQELKAKKQKAKKSTSAKKKTATKKHSKTNGKDSEFKEFKVMQFLCSSCKEKRQKHGKKANIRKLADYDVFTSPYWRCWVWQIKDPARTVYVSSSCPVCGKAIERELWMGRDGEGNDIFVEALMVTRTVANGFFHAVPAVVKKGNRFMSLNIKPAFSHGKFDSKEGYSPFTNPYYYLEGNKKGNKEIAHWIIVDDVQGNVVHFHFENMPGMDFHVTLKEFCSTSNDEQYWFDFTLGPFVKLLEQEWEDFLAKNHLLRFSPFVMRSNLNHEYYNRYWEGAFKQDLTFHCRPRGHKYSLIQAVTRKQWEMQDKVDNAAVEKQRKEAEENNAKIQANIDGSLKAYEDESKELSRLLDEERVRKEQEAIQQRRDDETRKDKLAKLPIKCQKSCIHLGADSKCILKTTNLKDPGCIAYLDKHDWTGLVKSEQAKWLMRSGVYDEVINRNLREPYNSDEDVAKRYPGTSFNRKSVEEVDSSAEEAPVETDASAAENEIETA